MLTWRATSAEVCVVFILVSRSLGRPWGHGCVLRDITRWRRDVRPDVTARRVLCLHVRIVGHRHVENNVTVDMGMS